MNSDLYHYAVQTELGFFSLIIYVYVYLGCLELVLLWIDSEFTEEKMIRAKTRSLGAKLSHPNEIQAEK